MLSQKLEHLPTGPGVYFFKDEKGTILYVGKAGNIKHRVGSYFQRPMEKDVKTLTLVDKVADVDAIVTDTEKEAFLLENLLIKEHRPRYNVKLKDDKAYPLLKLAVKEAFPTLCIVRKAQKDGALYFGPYPSATSLRETVKLIRRLFPIRTCFDTKFTHRIRPCINYEMDRCAGPCCGKVTPEQYQEIVRQVRMFIEGKDQALVESLRERMEKESEDLHYETAARIRDQIRHIEHVVEKQKVLSTDPVDQDVIGIHREDHTFILHPLFIRAGKLLGGKGFRFTSASLSDEDLISAFLDQYYREGKFIPKKILIPKPVLDQSIIEQWLTDLKGEKVEILVPVKGDKKDLLNMACENAEKFLMRDAESVKDRMGLLEALKERLQLKKLPRKIEGFDISNFQGEEAVGSMVSFEDGEPSKAGYRHFKIKTIEGADDYGMMYEVLLRRYQKALETNDLPDLILLDGGKGQLNVAQEVMKELGIKEIDLISLAKERGVEETHLSSPGKSEEKVFHPQQKEPILLGRHSPMLLFLDRIRDEAHRFAVTYHKKIRGRETIRSALADIPGIGSVRQRELLKHFGSVEEIRKTSIEELAKAPKMTPVLAQTVYRFFHQEEE